MSDPRDIDEKLLATTGRRAQALALASPDRQALDPLQQLIGLPSPVWENQDSSRLTDGQCSVFTGASRCPAAAVSMAWIGCTVGEHLDKSSVCEKHALMLGRDRSEYHCRRCWDAMNIISKAKVIRIEEI